MKIKNRKLEIVFVLSAFFLLFGNSAHAGLIIGAPKYAGLSQGLVGFWSFNGPDMNATKALDTSGQGNHGTFTNMDLNKSIVRGKLGQALNFDGVDDYVTGSATAIANATQFTVAMWVYRTKTGSTYGYFSTLGADGSVNGPFIDGGFQIDGDGWFGTERFRFIVDCDGGDIHVRNQSLVPLNTWTHIAVAWDGVCSASNVLFYFNGAQESATVLSGTAGGSYTAASGAFKIARRVSASNFGGLIDDVRIYNRALTGDEIKRLYKIGATLKLGVSKANDTLANGLVGWWTFDDNNMNATKALDTSGQGNHGTFSNMDLNKSIVRGKLGQALSFDGVNDYVNVGSGSSLNNLSKVTVSAWIYPRAFSDFNAIVSKNAGLPNSMLRGWSLRIVDDGSRNDTFGFVAEFDAGNDIAAYASSNSLTLNEWQHIVVAWNGSETASGVGLYRNGIALSHATNQNGVGAHSGDDSSVALQIATGANQTNFTGLIDDVRIYNRALTADEIKRLYRIGATLKLGVSKANDTLANGLVGWWTFDDNNMNATKALDTSGQGNHGTFSNMDLNKSIVRGKLGQALSFDGVNDYVAITSSPASLNFTTSFSIAGWTKSANLGGTIFGRTDSNFDGYSLFEDNAASCGASTNKLALGLGRTEAGYTLWCGTTDLQANRWYHVAGVYDSTAQIMKVYIDGVDDGGSACGGCGPTDIPPSFFPATFGPPEVGNNGVNSTKPFPGILDDVRVYNRVLTSDEIKRLYNLGR